MLFSWWRRPLSVSWEISARGSTKTAGISVQVIPKGSSTGERRDLGWPPRGSPTPRAKANPSSPTWYWRPGRPPLENAALQNRNIQNKACRQRLPTHTHTDTHTRRTNWHWSVLLTKANLLSSVEELNLLKRLNLSWMLPKTHPVVSKTMCVYDGGGWPLIAFDFGIDENTLCQNRTLSLMFKLNKSMPAGWLAGGTNLSPARRPAALLDLPNHGGHQQQRQEAATDTQEVASVTSHINNHLQSKLKKKKNYN